MTTTDQAPPHTPEPWPSEPRYIAWHNEVPIAAALTENGHHMLVHGFGAPIINTAEARKRGAPPLRPGTVKEEVGYPDRWRARAADLPGWLVADHEWCARNMALLWPPRAPLESGPASFLAFVAYGREELARNRALGEAMDAAGVTDLSTLRGS